ncbi:MAG: hypothetical protein AAB780_01505 [Patescibacteria group bacterium]
MDDADFKDPLDADLIDEVAHDDDLDVELEAKKKKDLIDEDTVSADDLEEEEDEDDEPFDDVNDM